MKGHQKKKIRYSQHIGIRHQDLQCKCALSLAQRQKIAITALLIAYHVLNALHMAHFCISDAGRFAQGFPCSTEYLLTVFVYMSTFNAVGLRNCMSVLSDRILKSLL